MRPWEGNLGLTPSQDRAMAGQVKGIGGGGAGGGVVERLGGSGSCREAASTMVESVSTEWTDEKHSLYLNSMEESFVNQLYNHEFCSNNLLARTSRISKDAKKPGSHIQNLYSSQVLRGGYWGEVKFGRPRTGTGIQKESYIISKSNWIQHFMSTSNDKKVDLSSYEHPGGYPTDRAEIHIGRQRHDATECREATSVNQLHACCTHLCHLDSVCSNAEVTDQNFVDDFVEAKKSSRVHKRKRSRATVPSARDQGDPFGNAPEISNANVNPASLKEKNAECSGTKAAKFD